MTRFALLLLAALVVLLASAGAERAHAAVACSFSSGSLSIQGSASRDNARIVRSGDSIVVVQGETPVSCGTQATVQNTHVIAYLDTSGADTRFTIDLSGGPFSPGQVNEAGEGDEIDIQALMGTGKDSLYVNGGPGADYWRLGRTQLGTGVNLNAQLEGGAGTAADSDVDLRDAELAVLQPGGGNDRVLASGGPEFSAPSPVPVHVNAEGGVDEVAGGSNDDLFADYPGNDRISGGAGDDGIIDLGGPASGGGDDDFDGGPGSDTVVWGDLGAPIRVDLRLTGRQDTGAGGRDVLTAIESISTSDGDDVLIGTDGNNDFMTGDGNDLIAGLGGNDRMLGGDGSDTVSYATPPAGIRQGVRVDLSRPNVAQDTVGAGVDSFPDVENVIGSPFADLLTGTTGDNRFEIRDGSSDRVTCSSGADTVVADVPGKDAIDEECEVVQLDVRPETRIEAAPPSLSNDPSPSFRFGATKPGSTFECSLDGAPFAPCAGAPTLADLSDGAHSLLVQARDLLGAIDLSPAEYAFSIDTAAPRITRARLAAGGRLRYRLSEPATVTIAMRGRKARVRAGTQGLNRAALRRVGRKRVGLTAKDAAGNRSLRVRVRVR